MGGRRLLLWRQLVSVSPALLRDPAALWEVLTAALPASHAAMDRLDVSPRDQRPDSDHTVIAVIGAARF